MEKEVKERAEGKISSDERTKSVPETEEIKLQSVESTSVDKRGEVIKFPEEVPFADHNVDSFDIDNTEQVEDNLIQEYINVNVENTVIQDDIDIQKNEEEPSGMKSEGIDRLNEEESEELKDTGAVLVTATTPLPRKSSRTKKKPNWLSDYQCNTITEEESKRCSKQTTYIWNYQYSKPLYCK